MKVLRLLLFPFSIVYGLIMAIRNLAYDWGMLKSTKFNLPIISIGNLSTGGTGKTPHTEYIIKLLNDKNIAVLSRGYGRKTKGNLLATSKSTPTEIGDEPYQIKQKFPNTAVMVDKKRVRGIQKLQQDNINLNAILLDDAFQHRKVTPSLSILLTSYKKLYCDDFILPTGNLREPKSGSKRANIIVVTKIPKDLTDGEQQQLKARLKIQQHQKLFFSYLEYGNMQPIYSDDLKDVTLTANQQVFLLTGIADASVLTDYLSTNVTIVKHYNFPDHYQFTKSDIQKIITDFAISNVSNKIILTTEKDAVRLLNPEIKELLTELPIYFISIQVRFRTSEFDEEIIKQLVN